MNKRMNKGICYVVAPVLAVAAGLALMRMGRADAQVAKTEPTVTAEVELKPMQSIMMHATVTAYGDVMAGSLHTLGSASAASIARINVIQGQAVRKSQALVVLAADPTVRQSYLQAQTTLDQARAELERMSQMKKLNLATQSQLDAASKARQDAEAGLEAQRALGGGQASQTIKSPVDGFVASLMASQGDRVQAGASLMQIGSTDDLKILLGVDPAELAAIHQGDRVKVMPLDAAGPVVSTTVAQVQAAIDPKTQLAAVVLRLPGTAHLLPGSRVRAEIALAGQQAYALPRQAVLTDAKGSYVFQVAGEVAGGVAGATARGVARRVPVTQVVDNGSTVGVVGAVGVGGTGGSLDSEQPVVVVGNYELADGMSVRVVQ